MNQNILKFYLYTNKLKETLRQGWVQIGINKERLESVAEHVYGCMMLAIAIDSEYKLNLDMYKVLKMISIHELDEILMPDFTIRDNITKEERDALSMKDIIKITDGLIKQDEIISLTNEFNERKTKEAIFSYHIDKIECDLQAKIYDLKGVFSMDNAKEDLKYFGDKAKEIEENAKCASDIWIGYDISRFDDDPIFKSLIEDIKNLTKEDLR